MTTNYLKTVNSLLPKRRLYLLHLRQRKMYNITFVNWTNHRHRISRESARVIL